MKIIENLRNRTHELKNLEWLIHPNNRNRMQNFGPNSYLIINSDRKQSKNKRIYLNIAASAADGGEGLRESLDEFEEKCNEFGAELGQRTKELSKKLDVILSTGGCKYIGHWVVTAAKRVNPDLITISLYPSGEKEIELEDPRRGDITHLQPYDYIIGTGMDIHLRSVLVGTAHILYIIHGGFGSAIEFNSQIDQKGIAAFWNIEESRYGMVKAAPELLKQTYKDTDAVFFRNTDYKHLIERSFIEWQAITKSLGDKLSAILLYEHTHLPGDHSERQRTDCALINFRECGKPVTYYHRGKRHKPIRQLIFIGLTPEQLLEFYKSQNPKLAKEMKPEEIRLRYERGIMFSLQLEKLNDGSAMQAMQKTIEKIEQEKGERVLFYDYRF